MFDLMIRIVNFLDRTISRAFGIYFLVGFLIASLFCHGKVYLVDGACVRKNFWLVVPLAILSIVWLASAPKKAKSSVELGAALSKGELALAQWLWQVVVPLFIMILANVTIGYAASVLFAGFEL